ncbi:hypothetical protein OE903_19480 [Bacillus sp. B6(2022)]|nr:hypothetical protein [Bacillus sp. B6(2022)]
MPAIYAGSNQVIHVTVSNGVVITNMKTSTYWKDKYETAVRIKNKEKARSMLGSDFSTSH